MENKVRKNGNYEMFQTTKNHTILCLDKKEWFAVVEGQQGTIIIGSDSDHQKSKEIGSGKYILVEFNDDPDFKDIPHLFLQKSEKYEEWILPQEFPSGKGDKKKVVVTKEKIDGNEIDSHIDKKIAGKQGARKNNESKKQGTELQSKSKGELMEMAKQKGLKNTSKMKKTDLVKELENK
jgi:hypothetical protein